MDRATQIAAAINDALAGLKQGAVRLFGEWYGKPADDVVTVAGASAEDNHLIIRLNDEETIHIWDPSGYEGTKNAFRIARASRVLFEAYSAGLPRRQDNLLYVDYTVRGERIEGRTNISWFDPFQNVRATEPAVELW